MGDKTVRATLGAGLLHVSTMLVGLAAGPAEAATACDDGSAYTTWLGPATEDGSNSWAEPANWTNDVPDAESVVCIPGGSRAPLSQETDAEADVIDARSATVTLSRKLTVGTSFDVAALVGRRWNPGRRNHDRD